MEAECVGQENQDEHMIVIVVNEEDGNEEALKIKEEPKLDEELQALLDSAGAEWSVDDDAIHVKTERLDSENDEFLYEYLDDQYLDDEPTFSSKENEESSQDSDEEGAPKRSLIADLRKRPEFRRDKEAVVMHLAQKMRDTKPPLASQNAFRLEFGKYYCNSCNKVFEAESVMRRHWQDKHGPRYLVCYACGADFRSTTNLYKHELHCKAFGNMLVVQARAVYLGRKARARPFISQTAANPKQYGCSYCPAMLNSKASLRGHERLHTMDRPYVCEQCPRAYANKSALQKHLSTHGEATYMCDHCGRAFKHKTSLLTHYDTHLDVKKFGCEECEKRYATKSALKLHVHLRHRHLPPPCACDICPKRFARMWLLKNHMRREHGMILMTRRMFLRRLPDLSETQVEQAKVVFKFESKHAQVEDY